MALRHYLAARERRHHIPADFGYRDVHLVDWEALAGWLERLVELAQRPGEDWWEALERLCERVFAVWLARNGNGESTWLRDAKHPLERVLRDLDWIAGELKLAKLGAARQETAGAAPEGPSRAALLRDVAAKVQGVEPAEFKPGRSAPDEGVDDDAAEAAEAVAEYRRRLGVEVAA